MVRDTGIEPAQSDPNHHSRRSREEQPRNRAGRVKLATRPATQNIAVQLEPQLMASFFCGERPREKVADNFYTEFFWNLLWPKIRGSLAIPAVWFGGSVRRTRVYSVLRRVYSILRRVIAGLRSRAALLTVGLAGGPGGLRWAAALVLVVGIGLGVGNLVEQVTRPNLLGPITWTPLTVCPSGNASPWVMR